MTATDKLAGIKPGDRVRAVAYGEVLDIKDGSLLVRPDGAKMPWSLYSCEIAAPTFQIERLEKPLEIGSAVKHLEERGVILAIADGFAWVSWEITNAPTTVLLSDLERIA